MPMLLDRLSWTGWLYPSLKWIEKFPKAACAGLVPLAVRKKSETRATAETWLRYLCRLGHAQTVMTIATSHGVKCTRAIEEILAVDERHECPTECSKIPGFFRPAELRAPRLRNGKALPLWAVERLGEMLSVSFDNPTYIGLEEIRQTCDASSLADFAWDLAQAWETNAGHAWMLYAILHFGDDDAVRRLTPALRGDGIGRMLGYIGTDAACMELQTIFARLASAKSRTFPKYAIGSFQSMRFIAACRGESVQEMADRFVPTLDLDQERGIELDLGTQKVRACFDETLKPRLIGENGNTIQNLPSASKVDPAKHKRAKARWKDLQEDATALIRYRGFALERAMIEERGWLPEQFRELWVTHPLLHPFARAVVWVAVDEEQQPITTFRIADDQSYANSSDETWTPAENVREIRVAHPGTWDAKTHKTWATLFEDYELQSPLSQFARAPGGFSDDDGSKAVLVTSYESDPDALIKELVRAGWHGKRALAHAFRGDTFVVLRLADGEVSAQAYRDGDAVLLGELSLVAQSETRYVLGRFGSGLLSPALRKAVDA